jgi:two-component system cell cycle sensor histidine kinase PleC
MSEGAPGFGAERTTLNARRAERRRHVAQTLRDLREQLAAVDGVKRAYEQELLTHYARNRLQGGLALFLLVAIAAGLGLLWADRMLVATWALIAVVAHLTATMVALRFIRQQPKLETLRVWRRYFIFTESMVGVSWALLFVLTTPTDIGTDIFQFATVLVITALTATLTSSLPPAVFAATLPATLTVTLAFALRAAAFEGGLLSYYGLLAVMPVFAQFFFHSVSYRLYNATLGEIAARAEKDSLIAELEQANAISDESRRKAEEANLAKSRFLATMSHELRTPLNAILGFSEVMQNELLGPMGNPTYKGYVTDIHYSGQHLLNLINEILDISRIEAGRYTLNEEAVTLPYIVEECVHMMNLRAQNKGIRIEERYEDGLPKIWADERALRQITLNLLSNAVKFTPSGGLVSVKVGWTAGGGQYVQIKDNGPGIPENEIPIVLSSFGQGSIAIKSAEQGTGLGLNIVQALVKMHGGTFDLKSRLREGTEVIATFPKVRVMEIMPRLQDRPNRNNRLGNPVATLTMLENMRQQLQRG